MQHSLANYSSKSLSLSYYGRRKRKRVTVISEKTEEGTKKRAEYGFGFFLLSEKELE